MAKKKKRYIISYKSETMNMKDTAGILNVKKVEDGVKVLCSERIAQEKDVLHFDDFGCSVIFLDDEGAKRLQKKGEIEEIVEDFKVFALNECGSGKASNEISGNPCGSMGNSEYLYYNAGYQQALSDVYGPGRHAPPINFSPHSPPLRGGMMDTPPPSCPPGTRLAFSCEPVISPPPDVVGQPAPWNISMVQANAVWHRVTGKGVKVAVLDTGIDENHPDLTVSDGVSFVEGRTSWDDDHSHGTHCAGIVGARNNVSGVVGVAPECSLYAVKVLDGFGDGLFSWILAGLRWARLNDMDVVSMSLGSDVSVDNAPCNVAYQRAAKKLIESGCIVVAAAGNAGRSNHHWVGQPARCPGFMAVAAIDDNKKLADFSSWGPAFLGPERGVEIAAPGVLINSTMPGGQYAKKSGTSMACPHVSGAAALLKEQHPTWTPEKIRNRLKETAEDLGFPGNDPKFGAGMLNCQKAVMGS